MTPGLPARAGTDQYLNIVRRRNQSEVERLEYRTPRCGFSSAVACDRAEFVRAIGTPR
jgi:hypothetical protein